MGKYITYRPVTGVYEAVSPRYGGPGATMQSVT